MVTVVTGVSRQRQESETLTEREKTTIGIVVPVRNQFMMALENLSELKSRNWRSSHRSSLKWFSCLQILHNNPVTRNLDNLRPVDTQTSLCKTFEH